jgi:hypothetical protein
VLLESAHHAVAPDRDARRRRATRAEACSCYGLGLFACQRPAEKPRV